MSGATPVAVWDEFDSRAYSWLQYLLAPMQDRRFQEGQISHFVSKCVFIFAGATSYTIAEFGPTGPGSETYDEKAWTSFKLCKGPDFHSRLDVLGPNQKTLPALADSPASPRRPDTQDVCAPLRRALLIRSWMDVPTEAHLDFDPDLLNALLCAPGYTHGALARETDFCAQAGKCRATDPPVEPAACIRPGNARGAAHRR